MDLNKYGRFHFVCESFISLILLFFVFLPRAVIREHIPKRHLNFEEPIKGKEFDNTSNRIYGESKPEIMSTFNHDYGTAKNDAAHIARVGRKTKNFEQDIQRTIAGEL